MENEIRDLLAAGARVGRTGVRRGASGPTDPYPTDAEIHRFRAQVLTMLENVDGSMSVSELREMLE